MSCSRAPSARAMNGGSPPTAPKARAGLLTPPGITRLARANASWLCASRNSGRDWAGVGESIDVGAKFHQRRSHGAQVFVRIGRIAHPSSRRRAPASDNSSNFFDVVHCLDPARIPAGGGPNCLRPNSRRQPPAPSAFLRLFLRLCAFTFTKDRLVCGGFSHVTFPLEKSVGEIFRVDQAHEQERRCPEVWLLFGSGFPLDSFIHSAE